jgi:hypothetical protein
MGGSDHSNAHSSIDISATFGVAGFLPPLDGVHRDNSMPRLLAESSFFFASSAKKCSMLASLRSSPSVYRTKPGEKCRRCATHASRYF